MASPRPLWILERAERSLWHSLTADLIAARAITEADLNAPLAEHDTAGKRLLHSIRNWGLAFGDLALAQQHQDDYR